MTLSIWRYSHLTLAITSFVFVFLATITGIILAFQPISEQMQPFKIESVNQLDVDQTITTFKDKYPEIINIEVDANQFVSASVITADGTSLNGYFNPKTAAFLGEKPEISAFFKFTTNLHRSLFLKGIGRFFVGLGSFLLFLIAITGSILIIKRQSGIKRFFAKVVNENFSQYWHVVLGRLSLIPIIIITLTGVYLSLLKFDLIPEKKQKHIVDFQTTTFAEKQPYTNIFNTTRLTEVVNLEFPFSEDEEDYYTLKLKDKEVLVHQYSGQVLSQVDYTMVTFLSNLSLTWHTGKGSTVWSIILLIACLNILFFIYSGFKMTIERRKNKALPKNKFTKDKAEVIILVGSETGQSYALATAFYKGVIASGKTVYISDLNSYSTYKNTKQLVVFTSTYGEGDAPINAKNFISLLKSVTQEQTIKYAVVGFGSLKYKAYCKYAQMVDASLQIHPNFTPNLQLHKIHNQSQSAFKNWLQQWNTVVNFKVNLMLDTQVLKLKNQQVFNVVNKSTLNVDNTFLLQLEPNKKSSFKSGDLLAVYPKQDGVERLYSIGKIDNHIVISVKKHEFGVCSAYFNSLEKKDVVNAVIKSNPTFNLPNKTKRAVLIANGTGIGPFLGMINTNPQTEKHLFWGGRTKQSLSLYQKYIDSGLQHNTLSSFNVAFSQAQKEKIYVQDIVAKNQAIITQVLKDDGVIMICGSVAMQNNVLEVLNHITTTKLQLPISFYIDNQVIKTDCY